MTPGCVKINLSHEILLAMKTKRLVFVLLVLLGMSFSSCYVEAEHAHHGSHHLRHYHDHGAQVMVR